MYLRWKHKKIKGDTITTWKQRWRMLMVSSDSLITRCLGTKVTIRDGTNILLEIDLTDKPNLVIYRTPESSFVPKLISVSPDKASKSNTASVAPWPSTNITLTLRDLAKQGVEVVYKMISGKMTICWARIAYPKNHDPSVFLGKYNPNSGGTMWSSFSKSSLHLFTFNVNSHHQVKVYLLLDFMYLDRGFWSGG